MPQWNVSGAKLAWQVRSAHKYKQELWDEAVGKWTARWTGCSSRYSTSYMTGRYRWTLYRWSSLVILLILSAWCPTEELVLVTLLCVIWGKSQSHLRTMGTKYLSYHLFYILIVHLRLLLFMKCLECWPSLIVHNISPISLLYSSPLKVLPKPPPHTNLLFHPCKHCTKK